MDAVDKVSTEIDKVITKFTAISDHSTKLITNEIATLELLKSSLLEQSAESQLTPQQLNLIRSTLSRTKEKLQRFAMDHRDLHGTVSKVGKAIDRNFTAEYTSITRHDLFQNTTNIERLDRNIAQHFYRQGMEDVAESLIKEANLPKEEISEEPFAELHQIFEEIHKQNLHRAIEWASRYSIALEQKNSSLEFKLHRLAFLQIVQGGLATQRDAIEYARKNLSKFVVNHQKEFQVLMGTLLYLKVGLENSPYKFLMRDEMWIEAADVFLKDACNICGINKDSPLTVIINAGCIALPALLNLKHMLARQVQGIWSGRDELPIDIEVDRYHSVFACPILRQQSTDENPPMKLKCGHVISRDALNKLSSASMSLKCPYCPMEQSINDAKQIYF